MIPLKRRPSPASEAISSSGSADLAQLDDGPLLKKPCVAAGAGSKPTSTDDVAHISSKSMDEINADSQPLKSSERIMPLLPLPSVTASIPTNSSQRLPMPPKENGGHPDSNFTDTSPASSSLSTFKSDGTPPTDADNTPSLYDSSVEDRVLTVQANAFKQFTATGGDPPEVGKTRHEGEPTPRLKEEVKEEDRPAGEILIDLDRLQDADDEAIQFERMNTDASIRFDMTWVIDESSLAEMPKATQPPRIKTPLMPHQLQVG